MADKAELKPDALPDLDDLLQCPVCYEIPSGQIFQCNEGHHVCGRCKTRLDMCPVCRALFFGTRNYAMEELIANVRKLRAFRLGGKVTTGTVAAETSAPASVSPTEPESEASEAEETNLAPTTPPGLRIPQSCKGLFRCLCCKTGNGERLPLARLLNHLRYFHAPDLLEGQTENGEYVQAWQFSTVPDRIVTSVRVADMGIFFLIIEIETNSIHAWLSMAASPWVAHEFSYTVTISGNDREAIFSDCVWSVRSCEGSLKKRGHCLVVNGQDARALVAPPAISAKLSVRRTPPDHLVHVPPPRAVLRVASRGTASHPAVSGELEPFLQDLQNDVARLSRAFATLGREADALVRSEADLRARIDAPRNITSAPDRVPAPAPPENPNDNGERHLSRNARRRIRMRLRAALNGAESPEGTSPSPAPVPAPAPAPTSNIPTPRSNIAAPRAAPITAPPRAAPPRAAPPRAAPPRAAPPRAAPTMPPRAMGAPRAAPHTGAPRAPAPVQNGHVHTFFSGLAILQQPPVPPPPVPPPHSSGPSNGPTQNGNPTRTNKKRRRQRR